MERRPPEEVKEGMLAGTPELGEGTCPEILGTLWWPGDMFRALVRTVAGWSQAGRGQIGVKQDHRLLRKIKY